MDMTDQTPVSKSFNALTPQCEPLLDQAEQDFIRRALQPLVLVFGVPESASAPAFWEVYFEALRGFPREAILLAVRDFPKDKGAVFFPKPGQLRSLVEDQAERIALFDRLAQDRLSAPEPPKAAPMRFEVHACERCRITTKGDHWPKCADRFCPLKEAGAPLSFFV